MKLKTLAETASLLCVHPSTLRNQVKFKQIGCVRCGGRFYFTDSQIQEYIDNHTLNPLPDPQFIRLSARDNLDTISGDRIKEVSGMARANHKSRRNFIVNGTVRLRRFKRCGKWVIDYRNKEGKRVQKVIKHAQTEAEAYIALEDAVRKEFDATYRIQQEMGKMTFRKFGKLFLENHSKMHVRGWEKRDKVYIESILDPYFGDYRLKEISVLLVDKYKGMRLQQGIKESSINQELSMLRKSFNKAVAWQLMEKNPMNEVEFFKEPKSRDRVLSEDEQKKLLGVSEPWLQELILFDLNTGIRPGKELLQELKWENVSFEDAVALLEETKSGEPKTVYLNSVALSILKKRQNKSGNGKGSVFGYPYETFHSAFKRACKKADIEGVVPHTLRHTFATRLIGQGVDMVTAKDLLHHSSVRMTERYTHPDGKRNRDAVERLIRE